LVEGHEECWVPAAGAPGAIYAESLCTAALQALSDREGSVAEWLEACDERVGRLLDSDDEDGGVHERLALHELIEVLGEMLGDGPLVSMLLSPVEWEVVPLLLRWMDEDDLLVPSVAHIMESHLVVLPEQGGRRSEVTAQRVQQTLMVLAMLVEGHAPGGMPVQLGLLREHERRLRVYGAVTRLLELQFGRVRLAQFGGVQPHLLAPESSFMRDMMVRFDWLPLLLAEIDYVPVVPQLRAGWIDVLEKLALTMPWLPYHMEGETGVLLVKRIAYPCTSWGGAAWRTMFPGRSIGLLDPRVQHVLFWVTVWALCGAPLVPLHRWPGEEQPLQGPIQDDGQVLEARMEWEAKLLAMEMMRRVRAVGFWQEGGQLVHGMQRVREITQVETWIGMWWGNDALALARHQAAWEGWQAVVGEQWGTSQTAVICYGGPQEVDVHAFIHIVPAVQPGG